MQFLLNKDTHLVRRIFWGVLLAVATTYSGCILKISFFNIKLIYYVCSSLLIFLFN